MNKHILFVIDHLANPGKYTQEELDANRKSAWDAYEDYAAYRDYAAYYPADAYNATDAFFGYNAAYAAYAGIASAAEYWVNDYFKYTGEDKQAYIDKL
jgi:hypothetical protein